MMAGKPYIDDGGLTRRTLPKKMAILVTEGVLSDDTVKALNKRQKEIKGTLIEAFGAEVVLCVPGVGSAAIEARETISIEDADKLQKVLGDKFDELVTKAETFKPTAELKELAATNKRVRASLGYKATEAVRFKVSQQ